MKRFISISAIALLAVSCAPLHIGSTPVEEAAYRSVVGAKAFLDTVKTQHPECGHNDGTKWISSNTALLSCELLAKGIAAKDLVIDAAEQYCANPQFESGGECSPSADPKTKTTLELQLRSALAKYAQVSDDLSSLVTTKPEVKP